MRTCLARSFHLFRLQGSTPFANGALAECTKSDANRRLFSSFGAAWLPTAVQQKRANPGAPACAIGGHVLLKSSYNPTVTFLRSFGDGDDGELPSFTDAPRQRDIPEAVASWLAGTHGIDSIVVEKVKISKLQREFWTGRDQEQNRNRPRRKLEETTNTRIVRDDDASCVYVVGGPEDAKEAVNRIKASQYIKLTTEPAEISLAAGNYIASVRHKFENGDLQIHLRSDVLRPGTRELRRLHRVDGEGDDAEAAKADDELMRKIDLEEIVLEVPTWAQFLTGKCREMEKSTATGIGFSADAINGRVVITIVGSTSTVKKGMEEVIRCIEGHAQYMEGDICLRRIRGESVDTDGFKKIEDSKPFDVGRCSEPFLTGTVQTIL